MNTEETPPVVEPEHTLAVIRQDYLDQIYNWLGQPENYPRHFSDGSYQRPLIDILARYTVLQLRALTRLIAQGNPTITILCCNPADHAGITMSGMYIGIEPDGYTHS